MLPHGDAENRSSISSLTLAGTTFANFWPAIATKPQRGGCTTLENRSSNERSPQTLRGRKIREGRLMAKWKLFLSTGYFVR